MQDTRTTQAPAEERRNAVYFRKIDWKQERPKLFDLLVELETAERIGARQQGVVIWRNDAPYALVNYNLATNAANLAEFMAAGNVPPETVWNAQTGKDVELTLDGKAIAELFSSAGTVVNLDELRFEPGELEKLMESPPPTNRTRLYELVSALTDDEITPALTALRAMKQNRRD